MVMIKIRSRWNKDVCKTHFAAVGGNIAKSRRSHGEVDCKLADVETERRGRKVVVVVYSSKYLRRGGELN